MSYPHPVPPAGHRTRSLSGPVPTAALVPFTLTRGTHTVRQADVVCNCGTRVGFDTPLVKAPGSGSWFHIPCWNRIADRLGHPTVTVPPEASTAP
jgi:hypothetical protein